MSQDAPEPERQPPQLRIEVTGTFLREARSRGVSPEKLAEAMARHFTVMYAEGAELFEDWALWSEKRQIEWCWGGASQRADLDFPMLEG